MASRPVNKLSREPTSLLLTSLLLQIFFNYKTTRYRQLHFLLLLHFHFISQKNNIVSSFWLVIIKPSNFFPTVASLRTHASIDYRPRRLAQMILTKEFFRQPGFPSLLLVVSTVGCRGLV